MKKSIYITLIIILTVFASCSVSERIVFNENMGGKYESIIDFSSMMAMAPSNPEKKQEKIDTLIVFNDILEIYKDSIANLPDEERLKMEALKDFSMGMKIDEESKQMAITIGKGFNQFSDLERVTYDMDKAFDSAKNTVPGGSQQASGPAGDLLTMDKVIYTFTDNTFRRTDPVALTNHIDDPAILSDKTKEEIKNLEAASEEEGDEGDDMFAGMMSQMEEELSKAKMKLEYVFPRKVISVSPKGAVISKDGKTVTFEVDFKTLSDNEKLLENFEVVLEDK